MKVKRLLKDAVLPQQAHIGDAGFDLVYSKPIELAPLQRLQAMLGYSVEIPENHVGLVCPRSGLALKMGLTVLNAPGIIDSGYRGELGIILINLSNQNISLPPKTKIAQMVVTQCISERVELVNSLSSSDRGEDGFGSTDNSVFESYSEW